MISSNGATNILLTDPKIAKIAVLQDRSCAGDRDSPRAPVTVRCGRRCPMPCALSRNARMLMVRCLAGEEVELTGRVILARRELERAGLLEEDSTGPTRAALRRRREFLPHDGPLSRAALAQFRRHVA